MKNFWKKIASPIIALAPMAGVTDKAFRQICKEQGSDVIYTEFASVDALLHGNSRTTDMISFTETERPVVVQLFGNDPKRFRGACKIVEDMGFDGIDINFGCPAYKVVKNGGGVACMRDLDLVYAIVEAACEAVTIPVSIKIRASIKNKAGAVEKKTDQSYEYNVPGIARSPSEKDDAAILRQRSRRTPRLLRPDLASGPAMTEKGNITALDLMEKVQDLPIAAVMIHARSYEQPFDGEPDTTIVQAVRPYVKGVLLANGGIYTPEDAKKVLGESGADGVGIARGAWGSPWIFRLIKEYLLTGGYTLPGWDEKKEVILHHARLAYATKGDYGLIEMRKHISHYIRCFPNAGEVRQQLLQAVSVSEIEMILAKENFISERVSKV